MSAYEGSKMQERDEDAKKNITFGNSKTVTTATKEGEPSYWDKQLHDAIMQKTDIPFEQQAEKKMQVFEAAKRLDYATFAEWMYDKKYFIGKL